MSLVYTSTIRSFGTVFGDCSLYAFNDSIIDAEITDYGVTPPTRESEYNYGDINLELRVFGTDLADGNFANIDLGLTAEGSGISLNKANVDLGLWVFGSDLTDTNIGHIDLGFTVTGSDLVEIRPEYNYGNIDLGFSVYGVSGRLENNYGDIDLLFSASGFDGTPDFNYGNIDLGFTVTAFEGYKNILVSQWGDWTVSITLVEPILNVHEATYGLSSFAVHQTSYESDVNRVSAVHDTSWSRSALAVHDALYSLLDAATSATAFTVHETTWDSFVKIPSYAVHEVSWASSGGTSMVLSVHESGWASVGSSSASAFTVHSTTWASTGSSATAAFTVHESSWNSIGAGSTTSVFTVHDTGWGTGFTPYSVHTSTYQSVVESLAVHHTAWNSFVVPADFAVHEARYRSYSLDPQFILANAYIEPDILLVAASVTADEDSPYYQCEVELRDSKKYASFGRDQPFVLHLFADEYHFVVDSRNLSRTIDDDGNYQETATISGLSPLCLKAAPRSTPVTKTWITPTYASALVEELIGPVTWNLVDWLIPGYRLAAESADPFDVAQKIVTAAGGLIESQPDGSVVVRHRWPTSIASLGSATLAGTLYETAIYAAQEQPTQDALMNRIRILDSDAGFQDRLEYVPNKLGDESDDPWNGMMYAYPSPWRENLRIATTRGSKIQLGLQGESVLTVDGDEAETITFESGQSSARYPIMTLNSFEWLDENLGGLTFSVYSTTLEAGAEGNYYGHSLAKIAYTSRRLQVPVACSPSTGEIEAQFLLLENQDGY